MRKLTIILLLCIFTFSSSTGAFASSDHTSKHVKHKNDEVMQLRLFQLRTVLKYLRLQFPASVYMQGIQLNLDQIPEIFAPRQPHKNKVRFSRALWTGLAHMVYATSSYWIRQDVMKEDWEYQFNWKDQKRRFLFKDGLRFDSNTFQFNWTHSLAGAMYYNYARGSNMSPGWSFVYGFVASYFWEFIVEFKEVISINDMIATPIGGASIGESMFQLGRFFRSRRGTFLNKIGRFLSNPILSLYDWLDKSRPRNRYAYDEEIWNDCRISLGARNDRMISGDSNTYLDIDWENRLTLIPEWGTMGQYSHGISQPLFTEFNVGGAVGSKGVYEFSIFAKSVFFGYFSQNIRAIDDEEDKPAGYSFFIGLSSVFDAFKQIPENIPVSEDSPSGNEYEYRTDKHTIIGILGPALDFTYFNRDFRVRLSADAYGDFALIHAHAFKSYSEHYTFGQTKSTLENHGYYYAWGISLYSTLQLNYANLELRGKMDYHYFNSIEGMDRFQPDIEDEDDFDLRDERFHFDVSLGYRIPNTPVQLVVGLEQTDRSGTIRSFFHQDSTEHRSYFQVRYLF